jgi:hypothetical protein
MLLLVGVTEGGAKAHEPPGVGAAGEQLRLTELLYPFKAVRVHEELLVAELRAAGVQLMVKSAAGGSPLIVTDAVTVLLSESTTVTVALPTATA